MARTTFHQGPLPKDGRKDRSKDSDALTPEKIITAFTSLPQVLKIVWNAQPISTLLLGLPAAMQRLTLLLRRFVKRSQP